MHSLTQWEHSFVKFEQTRTVPCATVVVSLIIIIIIINNNNNNNNNITNNINKNNNALFVKKTVMCMQSNHTIKKENIKLRLQYIPYNIFWLKAMKTMKKW